MNETEARARLVVARNGLEHAARFITRPVGRIEFFRVKSFAGTTEQSPALTKAMSNKRWHREYIDRLVTVGILEHANTPNQVLYEVRNGSTAQRVVDDFDDHGPKQLLHKLVFPKQVEVATEFDDLLGGRATPDEPEEEPAPPPEDIAPAPAQPDTVPALQYILDYLTTMGEHLDAIEAKVDGNRQLIEDLTGQCQGFENHARTYFADRTEWLDKPVSVLDSLIPVLNETLHRVRRLEGSQPLRDVIAQLQHSQKDTEAAIDLVVTHLDKKEADDASTG